jgi:hypothetical protein
MIDYKTWELETVSKNQQVYVDQCNRLHKSLLDHHQVRHFGFYGKTYKHVLENT